MSFAPITLGSDLAGWSFLKRTADNQKNILSQSAETSREINHFREIAPFLSSPNDLINDRVALTVALGSVGLEADLDNKFFLEKILREGTESNDALANLLSDNRYSEFAERFGFQNGLGLEQASIEASISDFTDNRFESLVGSQEPDIRLALNLQSDLRQIGSASLSNDGKWFSIMGNPPIRKVFEVALNLPSSVSNLTIDNQLRIFKERSLVVFSQDDVAALAVEETKDEITNRFLLQAQVADVQVLSSSSVALALLSNLA